MDYQSGINQHYGQPDLSERILKALASAGKDIDNLTREDLMTFDHFHIGGIAETRNLAKLANLQPGMCVLDVGCGIGGSTRTLAAEFGCDVVGVDLTEAYLDAAIMLTERVGLQEKIQFKVGSALDLPVEAGTFDVVWTEFVSMNIGDKPQLYREYQRVLRPGGRAVLHELQQPGDEPPFYPAMWADDACLSFMHSPAQIQQMLTEAGFTRQHWRDYTQDAIDWWQRVRSAAPTGALGLGVIVGEGVAEKTANLQRSLQEGRVVAIQAVYEKPV